MGNGRGCFEMALATATIFLHNLFCNITEETIFYVDTFNSGHAGHVNIFCNILWYYKYLLYIYNILCYK